MFRVVLTCWEYNNHKPYADTLSGVELSAFPTITEAHTAIKKQIEEELISLNRLDTDTPRGKEPVEDSDGIVIDYDYPFRADFDGNHTGIIRFWDSDDYQSVTAYDIHEVICSPDCSEKSICYQYRGFRIIFNNDRTAFKADHSDTTIFVCNTLDSILKEIDQFCLSEKE